MDPDSTSEQKPVSPQIVDPKHLCNHWHDNIGVEPHWQEVRGEIFPRNRTPGLGDSPTEQCTPDSCHVEGGWAPKTDGYTPLRAAPWAAVPVSTLAHGVRVGANVPQEVAGGAE